MIHTLIRAGTTAAVGEKERECVSVILLSYYSEGLVVPAAHGHKLLEFIGCEASVRLLKRPS